MLAVGPAGGAEGDDAVGQGCVRGQVSLQPCVRAVAEGQGVDARRAEITGQLPSHLLAHKLQPLPAPWDHGTVNERTRERPGQLHGEGITRTRSLVPCTPTRHPRARAIAKKTRSLPREYVPTTKRVRGWALHGEWQRLRETLI